ncbi:IspD/TarI family cytidylyltransferase [Amycolatopsis suaedae]|uniref:2-C-methyl-D-erythritol 4-phosphate cytidylyltransferase n=1 Tax=Amycolatopsis suaedae TaxID=2510978 RepID=A0A4Q7J2K7_9PSEU|nr:2-C-methyl-D-erythritol 4-phosphate cytidylyltransferase [Amycolatopsis suaedae]RZQ61680.1 hypothetical protein EWH70_22220 [Amycolatopsis suaedae]
MNVVALVLADNPASDVLDTVHGEPLLTHAVRGLSASGLVEHAVVVVPDRRFAECEPAVHAVRGPMTIELVSGGADRSDSLRRAVSVVDRTRFEVAVVHDAARALARPETVGAVLAALTEEVDVAVPVLPVTDTVKLVDADGTITGTADRDLLRVVQTPRALRPAWLEAAGWPADPLAVPGASVAMVQGHPDGAEIVSAFDFAVAETILSERAAR